MLYIKRQTLLMFFHVLYKLRCFRPIFNAPVFKIPFIHILVLGLDGDIPDTTDNDIEFDDWEDNLE